MKRDRDEWKQKYADVSECAMEQQRLFQKASLNSVEIGRIWELDVLSKAAERKFPVVDMRNGNADYDMIINGLKVQAKWLASRGNCLWDAEKRKKNGAFDVLAITHDRKQYWLVPGVLLHQPDGYMSRYYKDKLTGYEEAWHIFDGSRPAYPVPKQQLLVI